ncbi:MAG TPA: DUF6677 family protein [Candidatus Acidoferrum sp.]|nr:DUF6677 family protein [Candidatus Acidoferrum sp.]
MADETSNPMVGETTAGPGAADGVAEEYRPRKEAVALAIGVAGWALPGLGHALQKMWGRAVACFLTVGALVFLSVGMRGNVFHADGGDAFAMLGYFADMGTGSFYIVAKAMEPEGSDIAHAEGDDGTRFLAAAGVLNLLAALHAYEAARGRKA